MEYTNSNLPPLLGVIPLDNTVMFPGMACTLAVAEGSGRVIDEAWNGHVVIVSRRDARAAGTGEAALFQIGTVSRIVQADRTASGYSLVVHGLARCRVQLLPNDPRARIDVIPAEEAGLDEVRTERIRALGLQILHRSPGLHEGAATLVRDVEVPEQLIDLLIANLVLTIPDKQRILETSRVTERAELATQLLEALLARLPPPPASGSQCSLHGVPAVATCARCGTFTCDGCRGPGGASELCHACRSRSRSEATHTPVFSGVVGVFTALALLEGLPSSVSSRSAMGFPLVAGAAALAWLWSRGRLSRPFDRWEPWAALVALIINGIILVSWLR